MVGSMQLFIWYCVCSNSVGFIYFAFKCIEWFHIQMMPLLIRILWYSGRHASKLTEEEEDEECLKEEEDGLSGTGNTRLLVQPSCKIYFLCQLNLWVCLRVEVLVESVESYLGKGFFSKVILPVATKQHTPISTFHS